MSSIYDPILIFLKTWLNWTLLHSDLTHFWYNTMTVTYCLNLPLASITWIYDIVQQTDKDINTSMSAIDSVNDWISSTFSTGTSLLPQFAKQFWITSWTVDTTLHMACKLFHISILLQECVCWFHVTKMHKANSLRVCDTPDALVKWCIGAYFQITTQSYGQRIKTSSLSGNPFSSKKRPVTLPVALEFLQRGF